MKKIIFHSVIGLLSGLFVLSVSHAQSECRGDFVPHMMAQLGFIDCIASDSFGKCFEKDYEVGTSHVIAPSLLTLTGAASIVGAAVQDSSVYVQKSRLLEPMYKSLGKSLPIADLKKLEALTEKLASDPKVYEALKIETEKLRLGGAANSELMRRIRKTTQMRKHFLTSAKVSFGAALLIFLEGMSPKKMALDHPNKMLLDYFESDENENPTLSIGPRVLAFYQLPQKQRDKLLREYPVLCRLHQQLYEQTRAQLNKLISNQEFDVKCDSPMKVSFKKEDILHTQTYHYDKDQSLRSVEILRPHLKAPVTLHFAKSSKSNALLQKMSFPGALTGQRMNVLIEDASKNYSQNNEYIDAGIEDFIYAQIYGPLGARVCEERRRSGSQAPGIEKDHKRPSQIAE